MTNRKNTKRALFASVISMLLCVTMLVGSTFAWFTDNASTSVNSIQAGTLDIDFMMMDDNGGWVDAEGKALEFIKADAAPDDEEILWEPGVTYSLPAVKLVNNGNLALKFKLLVDGIGGSNMKLAEVLEVIVDGNALTKDDGTAVTLKDIMGDVDGVAHGVILPEGAAVPADADANYVKVKETAELTIALKMAEEAGNEYQGMTIKGLSLVAYATQYTFEYDSNDNQYDKDAAYKEGTPVAKVESLADLTVALSSNYDGSNASDTTLDVGYVFKAVDIEKDAETSKYRYYHADFVVTADKNIPANGLILAGQYDAWDENWVAISSASEIPAGTEIRLLSGALTEMAGRVGNPIYVNYEELCETIKTFNCGLLADNASDLEGTTITVELRLYETMPRALSQNDSVNEETGSYITIGTYTHTY